MNLRKKAKSVILVLSLIILISNKADSAQKPYRSHANSEKKIALTFDDGPHPEYTDEILDILKEYGIKATFFVIGKNCNDNRETVKREIDEGHEIGNHTYSHPHMTGINEKRLQTEIKDTERILNEIGGYKPHLFRPPEGVYSSAVSVTVENLDYIPVLWTVDTTDWKIPSVETIVCNVVKNVKVGSIILCHDYVSGKSNTPAALRIIIPKLLEEGYEFVTVSELIATNPVFIQ